jgi:tetratricopeptide (TPR) repeat protein
LVSSLSSIPNGGEGWGEEGLRGSKTPLLNPLPARASRGEEVEARDALVQVETALRSLANRSLVVPDQEEKQYALVPMVAEFLRKSRPEVVRETGDRLEKRAYALIMENGGRKYDRFPDLEADWPGIAPALPLFLVGDNKRLQAACAAFGNFLNFTCRRDEQLTLCEKAEARAMDADDPFNAGWRAYEAGHIYYRCQQADAVLNCADRTSAHWNQATKAGDRERAVAIALRGHGHRLKKEYPSAITAYREALALHRSLGAESVDVYIGLNNLAIVEEVSGDHSAAEEHYREALRVTRIVGNANGEAICTGNLAALALNRENWSSAETLAREALALSESAQNQEAIATACYHIAEAFMLQKKATAALPYARRAVKIYARLVSPDLTEAQATLAKCEAALATLPPKP